MAPRQRVDLLTEDAIARLRDVPLTYDAVGATAGGSPAGFTTVCRTRVLPAGVAFDSAVEMLMTWRMHAAAGLRVAASHETARPDAVVVLSLGVGRLRLSAPCRVVYVVDERHRQGFAYGTLPGHPECGEERFVVEQHGDGRVEVTIAAFSRPASTLAKLGGPATCWVQRRMTERYLSAFDE